MKKLFAFLTFAIMCVTLLASCNKECDNHVDDNEDGICDACNFEYEFLFKLTADKSGYELDRVGAGYKGGNIVIPSKYKGLPVVEIGYGAFKSEKKLTSVVIPDSVTLISDDAFENQTSLTSVNVGKNVVSIGISAFEGCTNLKTVVISDATENIFAHAFDSCTSLESITLGKNVKKIGGSAFEKCTSLKIITIPPSIEELGAWVFFDTNMTDIYFGVSGPGENWNEKWNQYLDESVNIHWAMAE
ncbi:MAG: leucine-rich repeat domain-containing protein [Clostridia bacterium]|nr:leucine-rich repeat domain-containing protein [Clostridia bacterium]